MLKKSQLIRLYICQDFSVMLRYRIKTPSSTILLWRGGMIRKRSPDPELRKPPQRMQRLSECNHTPVTMTSGTSSILHLQREAGEAGFCVDLLTYAGDWSQGMYACLPCCDSPTNQVVCSCSVGVEVKGGTPTIDCVVNVVFMLNFFSLPLLLLYINRSSHSLLSFAALPIPRYYIASSWLPTLICSSARALLVIYCFGIPRRAIKLNKIILCFIVGIAQILSGAG